MNVSDLHEGDQKGYRVSDIWVMGKNMLAHQLCLFCLFVFLESTGDTVLLFGCNCLLVQVVTSYIILAPYTLNISEIRNSLFEAVLDIK